MNQETLERLLIDRTIGELPEETAELLEEYLRLQPERGELEARVAETVLLANQVLNADEPVVDSTLPPLSPRVRARASSRALSGASPLSTRVGRWQRHLAIAAGLLVAFFLGSLGSLRTSQDTQYHILPMAQGMGGPHSSQVDSSDFWSLSRLQADRASHRTDKTQHIKWTGPLTPSGIGEDS